jgi:uncharacterized protein (DUF1800 family)
VEEQLKPDSLPNPELDRHLSTLPTLNMSATELLQGYPRPEPGERPIPGREFYRPFLEVSAAQLLMGCYSTTQLLEVMTDFWFNHFNVFGPEAVNFYALTPYVMGVIRRNALGRFPELVLETAKSPAMLYYLDNYLSTREISGYGSERGLNENYARELLELHTLGVQAGYTLEDIQNAARILTGWSITRVRSSGELEFVFYPQLHERGDKKVFGKRFHSSGMQEGIDMIRYLSLRPETAGHIAHKLAARFVSDSPPQGLVDRVADVFLETGGDIPSLLGEIFLSQEFSRRKYQRVKVKTPLRCVVSALRVAGSEVIDPLPLLRPFSGLGQPLFQCQPPTGYPDTAEAVAGAGTFLSEGAFTRGLAYNRVPGISTDIEALVLPGLSGNRLADALLDRLLLLPADDTRRVVRKAARSPGFGIKALVSLILATPDFLLY